MLSPYQDILLHRQQDDLEISLILAILIADNSVYWQSKELDDYRKKLDKVSEYSRYRTWFSDTESLMKSEQLYLSKTVELLEEIKNQLNLFVHHENRQDDILVSYKGKPYEADFTNIIRNLNLMKRPLCGSGIHNYEYKHNYYREIEPFS